MKADVLFTGVATADLATALPWYESLLGRAADVIVNDDEVMWQIRDGGWMYLVQDANRAGHALVAICVPDIDDALDEIAQRGLAKPDIERVGDSSRKAPLMDPEENTIAIIEVKAAE
jgi:predicted enzyme related to lactoylglutathione lyase